MEPPSGDFDSQRHHAVVGCDRSPYRSSTIWRWWLQTGLRSISLQVIHHLAMDSYQVGSLSYNAYRRIGNSSRITVRRTTTARCHAAQLDSTP
jgi:hypothetical protein